MKKFLSLVLAAMMVLALSVTAFAADETFDSVPNSSAKGSINADYVGKETTQTINKYMVTINWNQTGTLRYKDDALVYTWNTTDLKYDVDGKAGWTVTEAKVAIEVINKSDLPVKATCEAPVFNTGLTVEGEYDGGNNVLNLPSAAINGLTGTGAPQTLSATYKINSVAGAISAAGEIGKITVTLATP